MRTRYDRINLSIKVGAHYDAPSRFIDHQGLQLLVAYQMCSDSEIKKVAGLPFSEEPAIEPARSADAHRASKIVDFQIELRLRIAFFSANLVDFQIVFEPQNCVFHRIRLISKKSMGLRVAFFLRTLSISKYQMSSRITVLPPQGASALFVGNNNQLTTTQIGNVCGLCCGVLESRSDPGILRFCGVGGSG